jgi:2,4-dienoyl-CoA reductase-like NADH-dependent reductase (Old Yellow Enzyme family)
MAPAWCWSLPALRSPIGVRAVEGLKMDETPFLFRHLRLRGVTLPNRVVISPMQQYAAEPDGMATDHHMVHLGRFALGGAGLVFTEALATEPDGRLTYSDLGIWNDEQAAALAPIADFIRRNGAVPGTQLLHAGRKGSVQRPWHGYGPLTEADVAARGEQPWPTVGPSAVPAMPGWPAPAALDRDDLARIVDDHARGARRCHEAGFDVLNIHGGHGYLIHTFLSPLANTRDDEYGGDRAGRMKLAIDIAAAVRAEWPAEKPLFFRLSCDDALDGGWTIDDTVVLAHELMAAGVDVIDCSSRGLSRRGTPVVIRREPGFQVPYSDQVRRQAGAATMTVGLIMTPDQAEAILSDGKADLVAIGREALFNPNWARQAAIDLIGDEAFESHWPDRDGWWLVRRARSLAAGADERGED